jgi:hypothetical protein
MARWTPSGARIFASRAAALAATMLSASSLWPTAAAGADAIGATRAQIAALQAQVAAGALRVHELTSAYAQASAEVVSLAAQVAADQATVAGLENQAAAGRAVLAQEAVVAYTGSMGGNAASLVVSPENPGIGSVYLQAAAGDLTDATDQYRVEELQVTAAQSLLQARERAARSAAAALLTDRERALAEASSLQQQVDQLQAELQQLVVPASVAQPQPTVQGWPVNNGLASAVSSQMSGGNAGGVWLQLRECESGDNYQANTGNGYYGAYQFSQQTWSSLGYPGRPDLEPPAMQDQAAMKLQARSGWGQWPACSAALGLT